MNMPSRQAQRDRPAERGGEAIRRPCAAHPHMQRLALRARGRRPELVCLLVDLRNREMVGCSAGLCKDTDLARAAFAALELPISPVFFAAGLLKACVSRRSFC